MLTKARLDQYIKDGQLVPIGTELETIQLGKCIITERFEQGGYRCLNNAGQSRCYGADFKEFSYHPHTSLIDPTPTTVESPFSKEMLERIISDVEDIRKVVGYNDTRDLVISICNHLLTAANEFPCLMEVWDDENDVKIPNEVEFIRNGVAFVRVSESGVYHSYKHARPIPTKPKELRDVKENDEVYVICNHDILPFGSKHKVIKHIEFGLVVQARDGYYIKATAEKILSPYPPTSAQIEAARQSAID